MTELQTLFSKFAHRGTRLTLERTNIISDVGGKITFNRFWLSGPIAPGDFEQLKRLKPEIVAELERLGRFEMSSGDTMESDEEPSICAIMPTKAANARTTKRLEEMRRGEVARVAKERDAEAKVVKETATAKAAAEGQKAGQVARYFRLVSGRVITIWSDAP